MDTDPEIYENGCEFYKWYYYPKWDLFVMKIDGIPQLSNVMGGNSHTMIGIKLRGSDNWEAHLNVNANERFVLPLTPGQKRSLTATLKKFSNDRRMFNSFYTLLFRKLFGAR